MDGDGMAKGILSVRVGNEVVFSADPLLYGRMLVVQVKRTGRKLEWVACLVGADSFHPRTEWFYPGIDQLELVEELALELEPAA